VAQLDAIPGVGRVGAQQLIAEIGIEMGRFPNARTRAHPHRTSQAASSLPTSRPRPRPQPARPQSSSTGNANPWIGATIEQAAMGAARTTTFPWAPATGGSCKRRGTKRALVAIGNQVLTIAYHLLLDPDARFVDLGVDFHDRLHPQRRTRQLMATIDFWHPTGVGDAT
jgi:transposase